MSNNSQRPRTISIGKKLYHVQPYDGLHLIILYNGQYLVTKEECEIVGAIFREEPLPKTAS